MSIFKSILVTGVALVTVSVEAKTIHYELTATRASVNLSGKKTVDFAIQLNGSIPAPALEFTEGDVAEIVLRNRIPGEELSVHWHGLLLPTEEDGVPYVNTPPIRTGEEYTFRFPIRQHGTYWYHSHTSVQEQKGVYGAFVIHPRERKIRVDKDAVLVLSDWTDENPAEIVKNLRKDGDYYLYKKNTVRSWLGAIQAKSLGNYLSNEWTRMGGMDLSDVGYDAFLINGKRGAQLVDAKPGEKIRLRVINAAASTYFYIALGQAPLKVISADGIDIQPLHANEALIAPAETFDVLFEVPDKKGYEFKATAQDGTGAASGWIGGGHEKVYAPEKPFPDMYATMGAMDHGMFGGAHGGSHDSSAPMKPMKGMDHGMTMDHSEHGMSHQGGSMKAMPAPGPEDKSVIDSLTVDKIQAAQKTTLPAGARRREIKLALTGDMRRYVWHINNKPINEDYSVEIQEGEVVRIVFENQTMMHHPMHLHGHFFRVINEHGDYSPLKHTVDVPPHMTRTIEFLANEPGWWMLHCHNLYHFKNGMARVVKYMSFVPKPAIVPYQKLDPHLMDHWYGYGTFEAASNHAESFYRFSNTWNQLEARVESRNTGGRNFSFKERWEFEGDLFYRRWFGRFLNVVGGGTGFNGNIRATAGVSYTLPFLIESQLLVDHDGKFRLDVGKRFQWTKTILTDADLTWRPGQGGNGADDLEFEVSLMYSPAWTWGAGLMLTEDTIGGGLELQF